jgi:hypothetical protein
MAIDGAASTMTPNLYWIAEVPRGRLAIMARPRACDWLVDEMAAWYAAGLTDVICLLEDPEVRDLGLEHEAQMAREAGLRFERFPIPDRGVPASVAHARALWVDLADRLRAGRSVGIHCRAGIGDLSGDRMYGAGRSPRYRKNSGASRLSAALCPPEPG